MKTKVRKYLYLLLTIFLLIHINFVSAQKINISGYVLDDKTKSGVNAAIYINGNDIGISSNTLGFFNFQWEAKRPVTLNISSTSHQEKHINFRPQSDTIIYIELTEITLKEVVAKATKNAVAENKIEMDIEKLKSIPPLLGEADILKTFTLFPGVAMGNEGTSGIFVRGGTPDQNLLLLDNSIIFNPSHLLGFVSVFNQDAIKSASIYKGNFPSRYGGRLSAIVDVKMDDGKKEEKNGQLSIGLLSSRAYLKGSSEDEKWSYMIAARSTYLSFVLLFNDFLYLSRKTDYRFNYWMEDFNGKVRYDINKNHYITLSAYQSGDNLKVNERNDDVTNGFSINWGNQLVGLEHTGLLKNNWSVNNSLNYSRYAYTLSVDEKELKEPKEIIVKNKATISNISVKSIFNNSLNEKVELNLGLQQQFYQFRPESLNEGEILEREIGSQYLLESSIFVESIYKPIPKIKINTGYRQGFYYSKSKPIIMGEPRISVNYDLSKTASINIGATRMVQPIHLLNSSSGLPNDLWVPASEALPPAVSYQINAGFVKEIKPLNSKLSIEAYGKDMRNLVDYPYGFYFLGIPDGPLDEILESNGKGKAYGLETYYEMSYNKFSGWLSYTLSRNTRQFEGINEGQAYFDNFDRLHDVSLTVNYALSKKWNFNAVWLYQSGRPFTAPKAIIESPNGNNHIVYGPRNNSRLPAYHRLDIGVEYSFTKKNRDRKWSFGVINAYNRINPFYYRLFIDSNNMDNPVFSKNYSGGGLIPFLPYFSYQFNLFKNKK